MIPRHMPSLDVGPPGRAKLIVGPRQAGKSTFTWSHVRDRDPQSVLFLLAEEERVATWCTSATGFLSDLLTEFPSIRTIFLDEAQQLAEAGLFLKGLVDAGRGLDLLVTGSGAFHLESKTRESLAGRAVRRRLLPLSIQEIVAHEGHRVPAVARKRRRAVALRQMVFGGYPAVWRSPSPQDELREIVEAFVLRDASDRFRIERPDAMRRILQLAAGQVGQMANLSEWASVASVAASTVADYLSILEETWVIAQLRPFSGGKRREITHARRVHFYDPGIRNALLSAFDVDVVRRSDRGALLETLVFAELARCLPLDATIRYWRAKGGAEVDFVVQRGERLVAVEVKGRDQGRLSRSLRSFIGAYQPAHAIVACGTIEVPRREQVEGVEVVHVAVEEVADAAMASLA